MASTAIFCPSGNMGNLLLVRPQFPLRVSDLDRATKVTRYIEGGTMEQLVQCVCKNPTFNHNVQ